MDPDEPCSPGLDSSGRPMWKSYLYHLQQQAPSPKPIVCVVEVSNKPAYYGKDYHGAISRDEADKLLSLGDGSYLIRESQRAPGQYTLAIKFESVTKNFKLYYDGQHYVGEKRFDDVYDLVADGLITFYLEAKAADYIAALSSQSNYAESPYGVYTCNTQKTRRTVPTPAPRSSTDNNKKIEPPPPVVAPVPIASNRNSRVHVLPEFPESKRRSQLVEKRDDLDGQMGEMQMANHSTNTEGAMLEPRATPPNSPPPSIHVMDYEKPHNFKGHTFRGPHWCDFCANFLWGLIAQGVKCQDCGFNAHKKCSEKVPNDCAPQLKYVKRTFGVDLTTLVKAQNTLIPQVVELCVNEIEHRGLEAEGLYRVAGFHDDVEAIRIMFDKDGDPDITEAKYDDINTITSVLKLFFRMLPIPLITFEVYPQVMECVKQENPSQEERLDILKHALSQLPPAHYHTLNYFMSHIHRVIDHQQKNMMNPENLAIVFAPTLLRTPEVDPLASLTAVKFERELMELLILHQTFLFNQSRGEEIK